MKAMPRRLPASDLERSAKLHRAILKRGVYLVPSHCEAVYTSTAHINGNLATFHNSFAPLV